MLTNQKYQTNCWPTDGYGPPKTPNPTKLFGRFRKLLHVQYTQLFTLARRLLYCWFLRQLQDAVVVCLFYFVYAVLMLYFSTTGGVRMQDKWSAYARINNPDRQKRVTQTLSFPWHYTRNARVKKLFGKVGWHLRPVSVKKQNHYCVQCNTLRLSTPDVMAN